MASKEVTGQNFSLITRLPDDDTKEITLYGSAYRDVKAALFNLDRMEHIFAMRAENNVNDLLTENKTVFAAAADIMIAAPYKEVPKNQPMYELLMKIRKHIQFKAGINWCKSKRSLVKMYGRLIGAQEQGVNLRASPDQIKFWRDSVLQLGKEPLEYSSIEEDYIV